MGAAFLGDAVFVGALFVDVPFAAALPFFFLGGRVAAYANALPSQRLISSGSSITDSPSSEGAGVCAVIVVRV